MMLLRCLPCAAASAIGSGSRHHYARRMLSMFTTSLQRQSSGGQQQQAAGGGAQELRLTFASTQEVYFENTLVKQVDVPTLAGRMGILANHCPTATMLKPGVMRVFEADGRGSNTPLKWFVTTGTLAMNLDGTLQILTEKAYRVEEIDEAAAKHELEEAKRKLDETAATASQMERAEAQALLDVAESFVKATAGEDV